VFGDATYADAILDRIVHRALRVELTGESMRRVQAADQKLAKATRRNNRL
jgi:DNA replication protein DnaC